MVLGISLAVVVLLLTSTSTYALWPFKQKRFTAEAFINAGPLGLEDLDGRVVAVGDWNGDQHSDLITVSKSEKSLRVHLWSRGMDTSGTRASEIANDSLVLIDHFQYMPSHEVTLSSKIKNVVPGDFNHDGHLDLMVMYEETGEDGGWWGGKAVGRLGMKVFLGGGESGSFQPEAWTLESSTTAQPVIFDGDSNLRPSLLGYAGTEDQSGTEEMKMWRNNGTGFSLQSPPFDSLGQVCTLADPHSSAFLDIDGDCLPDLVLHCGEPRSTRKSVQIWLNRGPAGYILSKTYDLPRGSGPLSFADMNRDGTLDMVFHTCARHSKASGIGSDCQINIVYNRQVPLCASESSKVDKEGTVLCRGFGELCLATDFDFSFESIQTIPLSTLFPSHTGSADLLLHPPSSPHIALPLRPGDYNLDGYPDLLILLANSTAAPPLSGILGGAGRRSGIQVKILTNTACGKDVAGCAEGTHGDQRGFKVGGGKNWEALDEIWDAAGASWLDLDDDGSLDIMVQRTGDQTEHKVEFIQNNFFHDAFFLKALVLNGACDRDCLPADGGKKYSPLGVSYSGATYKFTVLDTLGRRVATQVAQLPQTSYHSLHSPYSFIGLGRTNNYIENLFVGTSLPPPNHLTILESLIPNSQVIINPPPIPGGPWRSELYLHPGDWIPWVGAAVLGTVVLLAMIVFGLDKREKKEDEKERRRALHGINFQAL
ncbi:integrin alpha FG-GAP repeat containing protein 1, partial [Tremellales sp. Uapishka_1]